VDANHRYPYEEDLLIEVKRLVRSIGLLVLIMSVGVAGYLMLGPDDISILDAVYMTVITLTTVGFSEVVNLDHSPVGRVFTMGLLLAGVGSFLYFFTQVTAFMVDGYMQRLMWIRRMRQGIRAAHDHVIVCGAGEVGRHVVEELLATQRSVVVIDENEERLRDLVGDFGIEFPAVVGDAGSDAVLRQAGIERATGVVVCTGDVKDNLVVVLSVRLLNDKVRIVASCADGSVRKKMARAGANAIVSPEQIGGLRMVSEMIRPTVVTFLDQMLQERNDGLRVEEVHVGSDGVAPQTCGSLKNASPHSLLVAYRPQGGSFVFNPADDVQLREGDQVVVICNGEGRRQLHIH